MYNKLGKSRVGVKGRSRSVRALIIVAGGMLAIAATVRATTPQTPAQTAAKPASELVVDGADKAQLRLSVNKTAVITTKVPYKRISVGQPEVADVNPIGPGNILVTAKKPGSTQIIIWDDMDRSQVVDVSVEVDLQAVHDQLKAMFPACQIEVSTLNGAVALRGRVPSLQAAEQAVAVVSPYADKVLNFLEISGGQQVMLQVRIAEVSRTAISNLGINGNYASGAFLGGSNIGQVNPSDRLISTGTVGVTPPPDGVIIDGQTTVNSTVTLYGSGQIGNFYLEYFLNALRENNLLRILAEPNLIAMSGQEASFLAGGEFPIPVTQGGGTGGVAITIEYREYGVKLNFVPVVLGNGKIRLKVAPEVSELDLTTAVRLGGYIIPGVTKRRVETSVELAEGQTFAIAGLLNNGVTATKDVTPLLGDLPVIGALFRSVRYQRKETELVVLVTPRLVSPMNPDQVPLLPGEKWQHPSENDLFWNRSFGGEVDTARAAVPVDRAPSRFRGQYGFVPTTQPAVKNEE